MYVLPTSGSKDLQYAKHSWQASMKWRDGLADNLWFSFKVPCRNGDGQHKRVAATTGLWLEKDNAISNQAIQLIAQASCSSAHQMALTYVTCEVSTDPLAWRIDQLSVSLVFQERAPWDATDCRQQLGRKEVSLIRSFLLVH